MALIAISGYAHSGKDTVGKLIQIASCDNIPEGLDLEDLLYNPKYSSLITKNQNWKIKKWAGKLKTIASILTGISVEKFEDQDFKNKALDRQWCYPTEWLGKEWWVEMTAREFLQRLGTDALRNGLHKNTWVNALMADYKETEYIGSDSEGADIYGYPDWIITDTRFPNEAQAIKNAGGIVIRVDRPGYKPINNHPSETELDKWDFDYRILNISDLNSLLFTINTILKKENKNFISL